MLFIINEVICGGATVLKVIKFIWGLLNAVFILIPIILILMIMVDLVKNVIASKEDEMKKNQALIIKRILMTVALFFVPTIVQFAIGMLDDLGVDFMNCITIATTEEDLSKYEFVWPEDEEVPPSDLNSPSGIVPSDKNENRINVFIGDSRCVGMKKHVDSSGEEWICKSGAGYSWFSSDAIQTLDSKIKSGKKYNLIINMGVNDLSNNSKYISLYNKMSKDSKYQNCKFIIVSVNPVKDSLAAANGSYARGNSIVEFNKNMKSGINSKISYCDTYSHIKKDFGTKDGVHYTPETYQKIYRYIKENCL